MLQEGAGAHGTAHALGAADGLGAGRRDGDQAAQLGPVVGRRHRPRRTLFLLAAASPAHETAVERATGAARAAPRQRRELHSTAVQAVQAGQRVRCTR